MTLQTYLDIHVAYFLDMQATSQRSTLSNVKVVKPLKIIFIHIFPKHVAATLRFITHISFHGHSTIPLKWLVFHAMFNITQIFPRKKHLVYFYFWLNIVYIQPWLNFNSVNKKIWVFYYTNQHITKMKQDYNGIISLKNN